MQKAFWGLPENISWVYVLFFFLTDIQLLPWKGSLTLGLVFPLSVMRSAILLCPYQREHKKLAGSPSAPGSWVLEEEE